MRPEKATVTRIPSSTLAAIDTLFQQARADRVFPGAVWAVGDADGILHRGELGDADPQTGQPMRADAIFDIASLTKITAVWALIGHLWERGDLDLASPLADLLPDTVGHDLGSVTVHQLLTHTAGVPSRSRLQELYGTDPRLIRIGVLSESLEHTPGEKVNYTDRAALILGYLAEHLLRQPLDQAAEKLIWAPLGMATTQYGPLPAELLDRAVPTKTNQDGPDVLLGIAHDASTRLLGGVCGISGVFSTLDDLAAFAFHMLEPVRTADAGFGERWIRESLTVHTGTQEPARGLFWHLAPGTGPAAGVWVHYGFTGTALWIVPDQGLWAVLLTNKVYFSRDREPLAQVRDGFRELVFG